MLTAMIGQTIKLRWKLSLQVRGKGGAARLIATDYYAPPEKEGEPGRIRAYASYDEERLDPPMRPVSTRLAKAIWRS